MKYRPLNMFMKQTDELKQLIAEHPDYPIVVLCDSDIVCDDGGWWYAPELRFSVGEILDCHQTVDDMRTYDDRDDFEEDITNMLAGNDKYASLSDEKFEAEVQKVLSEYEPYWKPVIEIRASV